MNIQALKEKFASLGDLTTFSDDPFLFILLLGTIIVIFLLLLLKLSFNSMRKADQRKIDQFTSKNEIANK